MCHINDIRNSDIICGIEEVCGNDIKWDMRYGCLTVEELAALAAEVVMNSLWEFLLLSWVCVGAKNSC